jgi:phage protein D
MRFRPVYRLVIGSVDIDITKDVSASTLVRLTVECAMDAPADHFTLTLTPKGGVQPEVGNDIKIELGFDDELTLVFTGKVTEVAPKLTAMRVAGLSPIQDLLALRVDQTYEQRTAGQIVSDLASQASVNTATVEDGISFAQYVVDSRQSAAAHIHLLAQRCGFDAYVTPEGELAFRRFTQQARSVVFTYGETLLDYSLTTRPVPAREVQVIGESPASSEGEDAASWLTKEFQVGKATGSGGTGTIVVSDPAMRTTAAANQRADGIMRRYRQRAKIGTLRALGRPELVLGDAIRIEDAPDERLNNVFQVRAIRHRLDRRLGLITEADFWDMP